MLPTPDLEAAVAMDSHNLDVSALRDEDSIVDVPSPNVAQKKKKKKKAKKSAQPQEEKNNTKSESRPNVLCISRNKHWKFISSYHVRTTLHLVFNSYLAFYLGTLASAPR